MAYTPSRQIGNLTKCVNKICLKQQDILEKQEYIFESNGWDRDCEPVCLSISGPTDENYFSFTDHSTGAQVVLQHSTYPTGADIDGAHVLNLHAPLVLTPNQVVKTYIQSGEGALQEVFVNFTKTLNDASGPYELVVSQDAGATIETGAVPGFTGGYTGGVKRDQFTTVSLGGCGELTVNTYGGL